MPFCANDCDDNNPDRFPGNPEHPLRDNTCDDNIDNDCDNIADAADPDCIGSCNAPTSPKDVPHFFILLNPDDTVHPDNNALACGKCHADDFRDPIRYACERCHSDPEDDSSLLNGITKALYPLDPPYGYGSAPEVRMHESTVVGTKYGNWVMGSRGCTVCHNPHAQEQNNQFESDYGMYIKEYICFDNNVTEQSVEEFVELTFPTGTGSFADGAPHTANVCEMCHTRTNHHQRDGSAPGGQSHFDGEKCTQCHIHNDGFLPTGAEATPPHNASLINANCQFCHVEETGVVNFSAEIPDDNCQRCHGQRATHTSDPARNSDSTGKYNYDLMCIDCHNPMLPVGNNRKTIRELINFERASDGSNVSDNMVVNTTRRGMESLGAGAAFTGNICHTCRSVTAHSNVNGDGGHFTGEYCMLCHDHNTYFMVPGKTCLEEKELGCEALLP